MELPTLRYRESVGTLLHDRTYEIKTTYSLKVASTLPFMHLKYGCIKMALYRKTTLTEVLDLSKSGIDKLVANDPTFPRPIKLGENRQSAVFFDSEEVAVWIESKKAMRLAVVKG